MRKWFVIPILLLIYLIAERLLVRAIPLDWKPFTSREGAFVVTMPGEPREKVVPLQTANGPVDLHCFVTQPVGGTRAYLACYQIQSAVAASRPAQLMLAGSVNAFKKMAADGGRLLTSRSCSVQGFPGWELAMITSRGMFMFEHLCVANRRLYQVMVTAPGERAADADEMKFINSFRVLKEH